MSNTIEWGNPYTHEQHSRTSYHRNELNWQTTCEWCGTLNGHGGLFEYDKSGKLFCSKQCHNIYFS